LETETKTEREKEKRPKYKLKRSLSVKEFNECSNKTRYGQVLQLKYAATDNKDIKELAILLEQVHKAETEFNDWILVKLAECYDMKQQDVEALSNTHATDMWDFLLDESMARKNSEPPAQKPSASETTTATK
jgi:hypothetical protein